MLNLVMVGLLAVGAFHFFGPVGIIAVGVLLLIKNK